MANLETALGSVNWSRTLQFLLYVGTPFLVQIIMIMLLKLYVPPPSPPVYANELPEFQIQSASLATFTAPWLWWSKTVDTDLNISLTATNQLGYQKIKHDFSEISVFHNDTRSYLSREIYPSFVQVPNDDLFLHLKFHGLPFKLHASAAIDEERLSVDVVLLGTISNEDRHWSKNFTAICRNLELQFFRLKLFSSRELKAKMTNERPVKCKFIWKTEEED